MLGGHSADQHVVWLAKDIEAGLPQDTVANYLTQALSGLNLS